MKKLISLVLAVALVLAMSTFALADDTYELRLSTTQTDTSMIYAGLQAAADRIAEETNGAVQVTVYPSGQLASRKI